MFSVLTVPAFNDNYIWVIKDSQSERCIVVDPGEAEPVKAVLAAQNLSIEAILLTHGHHDHSGGVQELLGEQQDIKVFAHKNLFEQVSQVSEGEQLAFFDGRLQLSVWHLPGHTLDHIAFVHEQMLFCGDTLFSAGCGRVFEGTYQQMYSALNRLASLADSTKVYCAHEYTQSNLTFALVVDPENKKLLDYTKQVSKLRQQGLPSLPSTIGLEKAINPFLRCDDQQLINSLQNCLAKSITKGEDCFKELRLYKDRF